MILSAATASGTAGGIFFSLYPDLDNIGGSADSRVDGYRLTGTVAHTGAALHTGIEINNMGLLLFHFKNPVGADFRTQAAANALFLV